MVEPAARERLEALLEGVAVLPSEPADRAIESDPQLPAKDRPVLLGALAAGAGFLLTGDVAHFGQLMETEVAGVRVLLPGAYLRERDIR